MESFQLAILLTTAGATVGAALIKTLVSAGKQLGFVPEYGRGPMYAAAVLAGVLIALAVWDSTLLTDGVDAGDVFLIFLSFFGLYAAAIGIHETAVKVQRIASGTTNSSGPDV